MGTNLRARLQRIRELGPQDTSNDGVPDKLLDVNRNTDALPQDAVSLPGPDWVSVGYQAVKRSVVLDFASPLPAALPFALPRTMAILVPDLFRYSGDPAVGVRPEDLRFFDLETTGLSGGAGTVAFLAAFGRFVQAGDGGIRPVQAASGSANTASPEAAALQASAATQYRLRIDQYLLLDYPGENDFLEAVLREFQTPGSADSIAANAPGSSPPAAPPVPDRPPLMVTYNGKTFDAQILKTRCLMNGIIPPEYHHADLLHPARRLWKRMLPSCSQGEIETAVLGLDRTGDTPGALAPDIWFGFLKTGVTEPLLGICDHNLKDIFGLASLFAALAEIAAAPLKKIEQYHYDPERLALRWRKICRQDRCFSPKPFFQHEDRETGAALIAEAACRGYPQAMRVLAIDAEWRLKDPEKALALVEAALALSDLPEALRDELCRRRDRLCIKTEKLKDSLNRENR
ncbi:hypothetical protein FACS1894130_08400 [Spirochaetia bacterium]|nr:hypothetical protein FACS1894130_08400 [Spirochaetia bacterium]